MIMTKKSLKLVKRPVATQSLPEIPQLTPAEQAEVDRFKALTARRAARRAIVTRLMARFQAMDDISNAA
jgi:hypothetical protein